MEYGLEYRPVSARCISCMTLHRRLGVFAAVSVGCF
jgi:hypothetical protein